MKGIAQEAQVILAISADTTPITAARCTRGLLPSAIAVEIADIIGERLTPRKTDVGFGIDPCRLDRPPRPFAAI
jgi:hypothetical protein